MPFLAISIPRNKPESLPSEQAAESTLKEVLNVGHCTSKRKTTHTYNGLRPGDGAFPLRVEIVLVDGGGVD